MMNNNFISDSKKTILLRGSWQSCNIGDIAHTLGIYQLVDRYLDDVHIILWPGFNGPEELALLRYYCPQMEILDASDQQQIDRAMERSDLLIHGSGSGIPGREAIEYWLAHTDKPFGLFAVSITNTEPDLIELLNQASFVFTRETESLELLKQANCTCPVQQFAPDSTFAMDIRNPEAANHILDKHHLEPGQFICAIPRLRYTPYHQIRRKEDLSPDWTQEKIDHITKVNEQHQFEDAKRLHEPIIRWVRETGGKVLVCPEMTYQIDIMDSLVIDPLPDDVKTNVTAQREYWMPDAAQGVYDQAACVVSMECHSPIMAWRVGTPAIYLRQPEDTIKGQMYYDLGLNDWVFEIEQAAPADVAQRVMGVHTHLAKATATGKSGLEQSEQLHKQSFLIVGQFL